MRNFFHLTISVILGSFIGYALYYKILDKPITVKASDIAVDELFLADHAAFERKQQEILTSKRTTYADTLQVSLTLFETPQSSKSAVAAARSSEAKPIKIIETMRPIEVAQLQKPKTVSIPVSKMAAPEMKEIASAHMAPTTQEVTATATSAEADANDQAPVDKRKKFLFFGKKSKSE
jgi:hypothetical protein